MKGDTGMASGARRSRQERGCRGKAEEASEAR